MTKERKAKAKEGFWFIKPDGRGAKKPPGLMMMKRMNGLFPWC